VSCSCRASAALDRFVARTATKLRVLCYKSMRAPWARNDWILQVIDKLARRGKASSGCGALILVGTLLLSACGGGGSTQGPVATATSSNSGGSSPVSPSSMSSGSGASIPATFFAVNDTNPNDPPRLNYGTLGHAKLAWTAIEPSKGTFDFSFFDAYANIAPKDPDGTANVVLTLGMTPPWATADQSKCKTFGNGMVGCTVPPDHTQDWVNFITALINHYNGTNAPHIKYYELWNEASTSIYWTGTPAQLAALAAAAYPIIKQDSHSLVISPSIVGDARSLTTDALTFLATYLQAGGAENSDLAAYHGYVAKKDVVPYPLPTAECTLADCTGSIITQVSNYRQLLDQNGMQGKPLASTEGSFRDVITDLDTAAAWVAQYYVLQASVFQTLNVQFVSWYSWATPGIVSLQAPGHTPNQAGVAYNQVYDWLVGAAFTAPCSNAGNIWTCNITRSSGYQAQIIWDSSQTCNSGICTTSDQATEGLYTQYRDLAGDPATAIVGNAVAVGLKPIILENQNP